MSDLIDRDDAIMAVKVGALSAATLFGRTDEGSTALYETVRAIKSIPSAQPECKRECMPMYADVSDCISRQAALEAMDTWDKFGCDPDGKLVRYDDDKHYVPYVHYEDMVHAIKHLPSAQPETHEERTETHARDLIDRQAAIDALNKMKIYRPLDSDRYVISDCLNEIVNLPSAQPEIIRCKDCAHYQTDWKPLVPDVHYCGVMDSMMKEDDFCSYAERRQE